MKGRSRSGRIWTAYIGPWLQSPRCQLRDHHCVLRSVPGTHSAVPRWPRIVPDCSGCATGPICQELVLTRLSLALGDQNKRGDLEELGRVLAVQE